jgi:hypothetical protein
LQTALLTVAYFSTSGRMNVPFDVRSTTAGRYEAHGSLHWISPM